MPTRKQHITGIVENFQIIKHQMVAAHQAAHGSSVTPTQRFVLYFIAKRHTARVKDVAQALHITSSAATQLIESLVAGGFVVRKHHAADRRSVELSLSVKAHKRIAKIKAQGIATMSSLFEVLTDTELATYYKLNKKITDSLKRDASM